MQVIYKGVQHVSQEHGSSKALDPLGVGGAQGCRGYSSKFLMSLNLGMYGVPYFRPNSVIFHNLNLDL